MPSSPSAPLGTATLSPVELLQDFMRFDTTNPTGNEKECITYIQTIHGLNERIPLDALEFGCQTMYQLLLRFDQGERGPSPLVNVT